MVLAAKGSPVSSQLRRVTYRRYLVFKSVSEMITGAPKKWSITVRAAKKMISKISTRERHLT
jgi:hypothetical protein